MAPGAHGSVRDASLDALRGLTVVAMGFVNLQGSQSASFAQFVHAAWHGMTAADLVFPFFLLIGGLATPLALDSGSSAPTTSAIVRRALVLIAIGVALNWLLRPTTDFADLRLTGVLQRIGIVYLACAWLARASRGYATAFMTAAVLLVLHTVLVLLVPAPGEHAASLEPGAGLSGWLDRAALPGRLLRKTYDPEGVLSTAPAAASGLIGVGVMRWLTVRAVNDAAARTRAIAAFGLAMLLAGAAATSLVPLNKPLWTASFTLVTAALGLLTWALLRAIWSIVGDTFVGRASVLLGKTALTLYVVQTLVIALLVIKTPDGVRWWQRLFDLLASTGIPGPWASLLFATVFSMLCVAVMPAFYRRRWLLRA